MTNNNNLWRREPRFDIFVDLLEPSLPYEQVYNQHIEGAKHRFRGIKYEPVKSDQVSTNFRVVGNLEFKQSNWRSAMEYYNRSLLFAEDNSDNMSLAYANRSACFFHMQKYKQCLIDIELARDHNYPKRLMQKLDDREFECVKHVNEEDENREEIEPKLSFNADEKFPCMANVLEIQTNRKFGRHIVAKCDIDVGQTVLVEEGFVNVFDVSDRTLCLTCMRHVHNFIACRGCTDAMFCNETCMQRNDIHQIACGVPFNRIPGNVRFCAESILTAIKAFPTVEHLMEFVEDQLTLPVTQMPKNCSDVQLQYGLFLKLDKMSHDKDAYQNILKFIAYKLLLAIPVVNEKFTTKKKQRFLMHLIWQHKNIADRSAFTQKFGDADTSAKDGENTIISTCNIYGLFNHSCIPNLYNDFVGNKQILITTRPVKKGGQLFVCYEQHLWAKSDWERQSHLKSIYNFNCKCARCKSQFEFDGTMQTDPLYKCIEKSRRETTISDAEQKILKGMCYDFMRKYSHVDCSNEICIVTLQLMRFFQLDYSEYRKVIT